jgi:hypothetical protein
LKLQTPNSKLQTPNSKLQTPNSKEAPKPKHQTASSKHQRNPKLQASKRGPRFGLGTWSFFGLWSLVFSVSIPVFPSLAKSPPIADQTHFSLAPVGEGWGEGKSFHPLKHQTPNSKHQRNPKFQAPNRGSRFELGTWSLELLWCLELGIWSFFDVWSLVFGVSIPVGFFAIACEINHQLMSQS